MTEEDAKAKQRLIEDICDECEADIIGLKAAADLIEKELGAQGLLTMHVVHPLPDELQSRVNISTSLAQLIFTAMVRLQQ